MGMENAGPSKMQGRKMQSGKCGTKIAGLERAGLTSYFLETLSMQNHANFVCVSSTTAVQRLFNRDRTAHGCLSVFYKRLSYHRWTARRAMSVEVWSTDALMYEILHFEGHSRSSELTLFDKPCIIYGRPM